MLLVIKNILPAILVSLILFANQPFFAENENQGKGNLIVRISGFQNDNGFALTALSKNEKEFKNEGEPDLGGNSLIINLESEYVFEELPFGLYAVKVFHDEDMNLIFNKNFLGMPTEDYGFSNNVRGMFGMPDFEDAVFSFDSTNQIINIILD